MGECATSPTNTELTDDDNSCHDSFLPASCNISNLEPAIHLPTVAEGTTNFTDAILCNPAAAYNDGSLGRSSHVDANLNLDPGCWGKIDEDTRK